MLLNNDELPARSRPNGKAIVESADWAMGLLRLGFALDWGQYIYVNMITCHAE